MHFCLQLILDPSQRVIGSVSSLYTLNMFLLQV